MSQNHDQETAQWRIYVSRFPDLERRYGVIVAIADRNRMDQMAMWGMSFAFETNDGRWTCKQKGNVPPIIGRLFDQGDEFEYAFDLATEKPRNEWETKTMESDVRFFSHEIARNDGAFRIVPERDKVRLLFSHLLHSSDYARREFGGWLNTFTKGSVRSLFEAVLEAAANAGSFD